MVSWGSLMGTRPWRLRRLIRYVKEGTNYPAVYIDWDDAVKFCKKLSAKGGKTYRLPTEAEWEYACRAGTETTWAFGDDEKALGDYAWCYGNSFDVVEEYAHQVGLEMPNAFGLYDMHGNVWEWCNDYHGENCYKKSPATNPLGPDRSSTPQIEVVYSGPYRVLRGGAWRAENERDTRSANRNYAGADFDGTVFFGFRVVRELD